MESFTTVILLLLKNAFTKYTPVGNPCVSIFNALSLFDPFSESTFWPITLYTSTALIASVADTVKKLLFEGLGNTFTETELSISLIDAVPIGQEQVCVPNPVYVFFGNESHWVVTINCGEGLDVTPCWTVDLRTNVWSLVHQVPAVPSYGNASLH